MQRLAIQIGIGCALALTVSACARQPRNMVPLPPLDAPRESITVGEPGEYRMQPGDLLRVKFLYHPELDLKVPIRPDGSISLQMAGDMRAAGLTTVELEKVIKERTSDRLRDPEISVLVSQLAEQKVFVAGEVRLPGYVQYRAGMTPLQAIMDRGGFNDVARIDSVLRVSPSRNEYEGTRIDFTKTLSTGAPEGTQLSAGDVIFVPRTFVGDVNNFVKLYIRGLLPIEPRVGAGTTF